MLGSRRTFGPVLSLTAIQPVVFLRKAEQNPPPGVPNQNEISRHFANAHSAFFTRPAHDSRKCAERTAKAVLFTGKAEWRLGGRRGTLSANHRSGRKRRRV